MPGPRTMLFSIVVCNQYLCCRQNAWPRIYSDYVLEAHTVVWYMYYQCSIYIRPYTTSSTNCLLTLAPQCRSCIHIITTMLLKFVEALTLTYWNIVSLQWELTYNIVQLSKWTNHSQRTHAHTYTPTHAHTHAYTHTYTGCTYCSEYCNHNFSDSPEFKELSQWQSRTVSDAFSQQNLHYNSIL